MARGEDLPTPLKGQGVPQQRDGPAQHLGQLLPVPLFQGYAPLHGGKLVPPAHPIQKLHRPFPEGILLLSPLQQSHRLPQQTAAAPGGGVPRLPGEVGEIVALAGNWEGLLASLQALVEDLGVRFSRGMELLPASLREASDALVEQGFAWLETAIPQLLSWAMDRAAEVARALPSFLVATVVFIMAAYFLAVDFPHLRHQVTDRLPEGPRFFFSQVKRAVSVGFGGYIKAQVILSIGVFFILMGGFLLVRQPYFLLLALALAVLDFIPIIGSGTVMVPWAAVDLVMGDYRHALGLMAVWGLVALFRRVGEPKILGDQTGLPPLLSLASVYVGMKAGGVAGMILGPVLCLVALNLLRSGVLDRSLADLRTAFWDISAILRGGGER